MSVAYQSWEVASGPTVGYKVGAQTSNCVTEGSNYRMLPQQDTVIRGFSSLSLSARAHSAADDSAEESRSLHETTSLRNEIASKALTDQGEQDRTLFTSARLMNGLFATEKTVFPDDNHRLGRSQGLPENFRSSYNRSRLDVVSEDRPWENSPVVKDVFETDTISSSSSSCMSDAPGGSPSSSCDVSEVATGDTEAQSSYNGPLDRLSSYGAQFPPMKGLSRFFSGKSRSFSCLADVASVKDLAKPENPYARKRKDVLACNGSLDRLRLHPLRNGATGISKKPLHNSRYTLALAVAMSTTEGLVDREEQNYQRISGIWQSNSAPSRSFSLSDLEGAGQQFSPP